MDWVNLYALAVNEENAAAGRVVTAPTNGAAGIIPAVLYFYRRNAMGAVKAINAARLALRGDGSQKVSLDKVIETMRQTGADMKKKYKETARGGLAVNITEC